MCAGAWLFAAGVQDASAATRRWDGSSSALWSDAANWEGNVAPVNGDDLVFPQGAANTATQNDIFGLAVNSVLLQPNTALSGDAYFVTGQPITIGAGGLTVNMASTVTWSLVTTLSAAQTWTVAGASTLTDTTTLFLNGRALTLDVTGQMTASGTIASAGSLSKSGAGDLFVSAANTYAGITQINAGRMVVSNLDALNENEVVLSTGATLDVNASTVKIGTLSGAGNITLNAGSTLRINQARDETFPGSISGTGNVAKMGERHLTLTGAVSLAGTVSVDGSGSLTIVGATTSANLANSGQGVLKLVSNTQVGNVWVGGVLSLDEGGPQVARSQNFTTSANSSMRVAASSAAPNPCSLLRVTGTVQLGGRLAVTHVPGALPAIGSTCTIIDNDGADPVSGLFTGLVEGAIVAGGPIGYRISYVGGDGGNDVTLTATTRLYYFSEGATGTFFDTDILLANPNTTSAPVELMFLREGGNTPHTETFELAPLSRRTVRVDEIAGMADVSFSTNVTSTSGLPIMVERTMRWGEAGYGAHTDKASEGAAVKWYFAEGSEGFFQTYVLFSNPTDDGAGATVDFLLDGGGIVSKGRGVGPKARSTIAVSQEGLVGQNFGIVVTFDRPAIAERSMYFGTNPQLFAGGHDSAGVNALATEWFLAEGATGPFFETFVLIANPNEEAAEVTLRFLPDNGQPVTVTKNMPRRSRLTVNIEAEDPSLSNAAVATQVTSTQPIVVERAQYWPDPASTWYEAHNAFGVTELGSRWGLAEGRVGGPSNYQTYILLANPGTQKAHVTVQFLRTNGQPLVKSFEVQPASRFNVSTGPGSLVPELVDEEFGAVITSSQPLAVERALYSDSNGQIWAAGTNATAARLP